MKRVLLFLKKNQFTQFILMCIRSLYFVPYLFITKHTKFTVEGPLETANQLVTKSFSISRFGDGEFNIAYKGKGIGFQPYSDELSRDLRDVLKESAENGMLKIGLPHGFETTKMDKFKVKTFWWSYVVKNRRDILRLVQEGTISNYLDASFTRAITELTDKETIKQVMETVKKIWEDKIVLIVEGAGTRFGSGNGLLKHAKSVSRIVAPAENAYAKIESIQHSVDKFLMKQNDLSDVVILVALGPTATVLASRFSRKVQTVDIGHLDLQYEYLKKGSYHKVKIKTRYDNEMIDGSTYDLESNDTRYKEEIVDVIR